MNSSKLSYVDLAKIISDADDSYGAYCARTDYPESIFMYTGRILEAALARQVDELARSFDASNATAYQAGHQAALAQQAHGPRCVCAKCEDRKCNVDEASGICRTHHCPYTACYGPGAAQQAQPPLAPTAWAEAWDKANNGKPGYIPYERAPQQAQPCKKCGQIDNGQTGEYPCLECGLPTTHDEQAQPLTDEFEKLAWADFCTADYEQSLEAWPYYKDGWAARDRMVQQAQPEMPTRAAVLEALSIDYYVQKQADNMMALFAPKPLERQAMESLACERCDALGPCEHDTPKETT